MLEIAARLGVDAAAGYLAGLGFPVDPTKALELVTDVAKLFERHGITNARELVVDDQR